MFFYLFAFFMFVSVSSPQILFSNNSDKLKEKAARLVEEIKDGNDEHLKEKARDFVKCDCYPEDFIRDVEKYKKAKSQLDKLEAEIKKSNDEDLKKIFRDGNKKYPGDLIWRIERYKELQHLKADSEIKKLQENKEKLADFKEYELFSKAKSCCDVEALHQAIEQYKRHIIEYDETRKLIDKHMEKKAWQQFSWWKKILGFIFSSRNLQSEDEYKEFSRLIMRYSIVTKAFKNEHGYDVKPYFQVVYPSLHGRKWKSGVWSESFEKCGKWGDCASYEGIKWGLPEVNCNISEDAYKTDAGNKPYEAEYMLTKLLEHCNENESRQMLFALAKEILESKDLFFKDVDLLEAMVKAAYKLKDLETLKELIKADIPTEVLFCEYTWPEFIEENTSVTKIKRNVYSVDESLYKELVEALAHHDSTKLLQKQPMKKYLCNFSLDKCEEFDQLLEKYDTKDHSAFFYNPGYLSFSKGKINFEILKWLKEHRYDYATAAKGYEKTLLECCWAGGEYRKDQDVTNFEELINLGFVYPEKDKKLLQEIKMKKDEICKTGRQYQGLLTQEELDKAKNCKNCQTIEKFEKLLESYFSKNS